MLVPATPGRANDFMLIFFTARLRHVRLFKSLFGIKGTKILEGEIGNDYGPPYR